MRWYVSADPDQLGRPFDAPTVDEAVALAVSKRIVKRGTEATVRHNVRLVGDGPDWLFANVQSVTVPGDPPKAEPAPTKPPKEATAPSKPPKAEPAPTAPPKEAAAPTAPSEAPKAESAPTAPSKEAKAPTAPPKEAAAAAPEATAPAAPEAAAQQGANAEPAPA